MVPAAIWRWGSGKGLVCAQRNDSESRGKAGDIHPHLHPFQTAHHAAENRVVAQTTASRAAWQFVAGCGGGVAGGDSDASAEIVGRVTEEPSV